MAGGSLNGLTKYRIPTVEKPLPIMWVPQFFMSYVRIIYGKKPDIGTHIWLEHDDTEYLYMIKDFDEETLEWKLVWPD